MSTEPTPEKPSSPLHEIIQPFIDLVHAPRALWGINLAYVIEGMVYFGMLGYLAIYCSEYIFQAIDGADEAAHYMVMVLTAGITIAMFFLGVVADKRGVRFALILAFLFMLAGRAIWSAGPNVLGLEPVRPGVLAGDRVTLHVTELDTRYGNKTITNATVIASTPDAVDVRREMAMDLSSGEGVELDGSLESKLVRLGEAEVLGGDGEEWTVRYGSKPVEATLLIRGADKLHIRPGARVSLDQAYVARMEKELKPKPDQKPVLASGAKFAIDRARVVPADDGDGYILHVNWPEDVSAVDLSACKPEYIIRSHWVSDVTAINTFPLDLAEGDGIEPGPDIESWVVRISEVTVTKGSGGAWVAEFGGKPVKARLVLNGDATGTVDDAVRPDLAVGDGTPLAPEHVGQVFQLGKARLTNRDGDDWLIEYGDKPRNARLHVRSTKDATLGVGARVSLRQAKVIQRDGAEGLALQATWPTDFDAIDTYGCESPPYRDLVTTDERDLRVKERAPVPEGLQAPSDAKTVTIAELREIEDGPVNIVLKDVNVTYVRNGGYMLQENTSGPGVAVLVNPIGSTLQFVTIIGMLLVVIGYGMYQPAAYAGVRKFTTPKTAAMGFAMLYALMNLGGWLPTFAFLLRDDNYAGLGIPGTFWVYTLFTILALLCTLLILSKRTVAVAEKTAREETARIKAEEARNASGPVTRDTKLAPTAADNGSPTRVKPHLWLFWVGAIVLLLFKGEAPWYYGWTEVTREWITSRFASMVVWRWILAGLVFILPLLIASWPKAKQWLAKHPLQNAKFAFFIFALIPVQTLFTYNWLVLPSYIKRAYEGWIGNYFEIAANANPILIFIAVPIITAITQKRKIYNMMIIGTFIMAAPAFLLVLGPHWWTLFAYILIMTIGEAMWQPRFLQYAAEIAPEGRTGEYMGVAQFPWFLTKVLVPLLYSGRMMDKFCPAEGPKSTEIMWFIFACIAMTSTILLILAKGWIGKDFKTKAA